MKWLILFISLAYLTAAEGNVVSLGDSDFDQAINSGKPVFVKFFAPWCGHCKALAPEYVNLAEKVKENDLPYVIAEVDATVASDVAADQGIRSYPTLKLFIDGNPINYEGERKVDAMLEFIKKKVAPSSEEIKDLDALKEKAEGTGRRCILVSDKEEHLKGYMNTGRVVDEFKFYHISEDLGKKYFTELDKPAVVVLRDFGETKKIYTGSFGPETFEPFLRRHQFDVISFLNGESAKVVFNKAEKKAFLLVVYDEVPEDVLALFKDFATKKGNDKYMFLISKNDDEWGKRYTEFFKIDKAATPLVEIVDGSGKIARYRHQGKLTFEELEQFLKDYESGKIEKFIRSEPIPENDVGPVYKIVAKNFNSDVIDNDLDVMVKFYAPWCGHCKALAPIYEELAKALKDNKKLKIAEMDATSNDVEGVNINSYPTIFLYQAGKKKSPIKFEGDRTEKAMTDFLVANCTNPVVVGNKEVGDEKEKVEL